MGSYGQIPSDSIIPADQLIYDLNLLKEAVLQTQQNPYTYCTKEELQDAFDQALREVVDGLPMYDFALVCGEFLQVFKDSHTSVNFGGLGAYIESQNGRFLNIKTKSIDGKVYVTQDRDKRLHAGVELIKFNNKDVEECFQDLLKISVFEGNSTIGNIRIADALFPTLLEMLTPVLEQNSVLIRNPMTNDTSLVTLNGYTRKELRKKIKKLKIEPYEFHVDHDHSLAIIKIKTFGHSGRPKYYKFLRQSYNRILTSNVENIVIDLRGNTGGLINRSEMLLTVVSDSTIHLPENMIARQSNVSKDYYDKKYKGFNRWIINHFYKNSEKISSYRRIMNLEVSEVDTLYFDESIQDYFPEFEGQSYALMNGQSGSASTLFLAAFTKHNLGITVGEDCLGPLNGTWGNPANFKLENTKLNVLISVIRTNPESGFAKDPNPIQPQHLLEYTPQDIYNERDLELEKVHELILKSP